MDQNVEPSLTLLDKSYLEVLQQLYVINVANKLEIRTLRINFSEIDRFAKFLLKDFKNIVRLDLSNCNIRNIDNNVFYDLIYLNVLNLSSNFIESIDLISFRQNVNLKTIILHNNLLKSVEKNAFIHAQNLVILDLDFNRITELNGEFLNCPSLKTLQISNNRIRKIDRFTFSNLRNLTRLFLNNNEIEVLVSNLLISNQKMVEVDFSDNELSNVGLNVFRDCAVLTFLSLTVTGSFNIRCVEYLKYLKRLILTYKKDSLYWSFHFRDSIEKLLLLTDLKLVFQKVDIHLFCNFSKLKQLKSLHIECIEPSDQRFPIIVTTFFRKMPNLENLVLKKLNAFMISEHTAQIDKLTHLSFVGVKNRQIFLIFATYVLLEFLDLSFSELSKIMPRTFETLVLLKHLKLDYSKLKSIDSMAFRKNVLLETLTCSDCRLETIEDGSFANLRELKLLNLYGNSFLRSSRNVFVGLNCEICVIIL